MGENGGRKSGTDKHWTVFKDPRWPGDVLQVRFFVDGRKVRKSTGTADPIEADRRAAEIWIEHIRKAGQPIPEKIAPLARATVVDAGANWIATLEQREAAGEYRAAYASRFNSDLEQHIIHMGWTYVDEIPAWSPEKLLAALRTRHKSNGGTLKWASITRLLVSIRKLVEHCMTVGILEERSLPDFHKSLPSKIGKQIEAEQRPIDALTEAERTRVLRALENWKPHDGRPLPQGTAARFYTVAYYTGLRRGELYALKPSWIDWKVKMITIPATDSKSGELEEIPLHAKAAKALRDQIRSLAVRELPEGVDPIPEKDEPVFGIIDVRKAFRWALKKAKITRKGITPYHNARHTLATIAAGKTTDGLALQALGRWRSLRMVERYTHPTAERARAVLKLI